MLNPIHKIINSIKYENKKIDELMETIVDKIKIFKNYNEELINYFELYIEKTNVERKIILK